MRARRLFVGAPSLEISRRYVQYISGGFFLFSGRVSAKGLAFKTLIQVATCYQFTIPLYEYQKKVGSIQGFSNIRFMRIYMTGFRGLPSCDLRRSRLSVASGATETQHNPAIVPTGSVAGLMVLAVQIRAGWGSENYLSGRRSPRVCSGRQYVLLAAD